MKSLMLLWQTVADELATRCSTSAARDCKTVEDRVEHEGLSFFTITLPQFGKGFERCLELGCLDKQSLRGFAWRGGFPRFVSGFLCQVFDASSGRLLEDADIDAIQAIRQLTLMCGKLFQLTTKEREHAAMRAFVECEQDVRRDDVFRREYGGPERNDFARVASLVMGRVFRDVEGTLGSHLRHYGDEPGSLPDVDAMHPRPRSLLGLIPVHGPGATADGNKGNRKWKFATWPRRLNEVFHMVDFAIPNYSYYERLEDVDILEPDAETPVRVVAVPKTQKTPRIIAIEPTCMMFMQKALQSQFYEEVDRDNLLSSFIGFMDQTPNQELAREGSLTGNLATLDLSEASDRVSCLHVEDLFRNFPLLKEAVMAVRSTKANVDGFGIIPLSKYASMGSALTFPLEAMVFLTICLLGIEKELKRPLNYYDVKRLVGKVRVFGDDIIVPKEYVGSVIGQLESFGMKVNQHKSFWNGSFRESCGKEYYKGEDVSIVRVRYGAPESLKDAREISSWVQMRNQFYRAGLWRTCRYLDSMISRLLKEFPVVAETSPVLGRHSFLGYETQKIDGLLWSPLVKGYVERGVSPRNTLDDHYALHKWFTLRGDLPIVDPNHLVRSGRPPVVNIKLGWHRPF